MIISEAASIENPVEITDGRKVAGLILGKSTESDVLSHLGKPDSIKEHGSYSREMVYSARGLSIFYLIADSKKQVFSVIVKAPYKLQTFNGVILNKSTMLDVRNIYGTLNWGAGEGSGYWFSEHDRISFGVLRDRAVPQFPLNEQLHLNLKITAIQLYIPSR